MRPSSKKQVEPEKRKLVPSSSLSSSSEPDHISSEDVDDDEEELVVPHDADHDHDSDDDDHHHHLQHRHPHSTQTSVDMGRFTNMLVEDLEIIDTIGKSNVRDVSSYRNFHLIRRYLLLINRRQIRVKQKFLLI